MGIIESEFHEKSRDIDVLFMHIKDLSHEKGNNVHKISILKSSLVLILYNTIESTVTLLLQEIHNTASIYNYEQLSDKLRVLITEYYFYNSKKSDIKKNLDLLSINALKFPTLDDFEKRVNSYSGNLDSRAIDNTLSKYGVGKLRTNDREKLVIVKNIRNKIAHGELMFKEACRNFTINELEKIKNATENAMLDIIQQTNHYLQRQGYLRR